MSDAVSKRFASNECGYPSPSNRRVRRPAIVSESKWRSIRAASTFTAARSALLLGDAREKLAELPAECANTCLTSPPYWQARDYGHADQIGQEKEIHEYVSAIVEVFAEVKRVLTSDGVAWLNLGD